MGQHFLESLGYDEWRIQWGCVPPSECIHLVKIIRMSDQHDGNCWYYVKEALLHEIAHIEGPEVGGEKAHDKEFFKRYGELLIRFADYQPINERSYEHG